MITLKGFEASVILTLLRTAQMKLFCFDNRFKSKMLHGKEKLHFKRDGLLLDTKALALEDSDGQQWM